MFCPKCGTQSLEGAAFCQKCGTKLIAEEAVPSATTQAHNQQAVAQIHNVPSGAIKMKFNKLPIILVVIAFVIAAVVFLALNWEGKPNYEATVRGYTPFASSQGLPYSCGEVFDQYMPDAKWKIRNSGDVAYVDISGTAKGTEMELVVTMKVEAADDRTSIKPISVNVDGSETSTQDETDICFLAFFVAYDEKYDDLSNFSELLNKIKSNLKGEVSLTQTYTNDVAGVSFDYPAGWVILDADSEFKVVEMFDSKNNADTIAKFDISCIFDQDPFGVFTGDTASIREAVNEYYTFLKCEDILIGGVSAKSLTYQTEGLNGEDVVLKFWYVIGENVYQITCSYSASTADTYEPIFNAIIESYQITHTAASDGSARQDKPGDAQYAQSIAVYAPIIDAYAALEQSGYTIIDENLIGDSLLAVQQNGTYNFGWDTLPVLGYAICDLNNNGSPELLIGVESYGTYTISGIYTISSGTVASLIQVGDQNNLSVTTDVSGNCVIGYSYGNMGSAMETFYTLVSSDGAEYLGWQCGLVTEAGDPVPMRFLEDYTGEGTGVGITEEEYISLINQYGASGYEAFDTVARPVTFDWMPILEV